MGIRKRSFACSALVTATLASMVGCYEGNPSDPIVCTAQFVYGLNVTVRDQSTGLPQADDATLTLREGSYEEIVTDSWDGSTLSGAGERAGTYGVVVEHAGYQMWTRDGVAITADECHVIPVSLTADLVPVP